ncbi:MAG: hypothetical protein P8R54_10155 [Myxococcota bacterium]|nr:hypothetical protein [Myxococcota bacterium]
MFHLMSWTDYSDVFQGLVLLDDDNWHAWRERMALSMTVMGQVKTDEAADWSAPQAIPGFQLTSEESRRFASPPSTSVDDLLDGEDSETPSVDLQRHYDALSRDEVTFYDAHLLTDAPTVALLTLLARIEDVVPSVLFVEAWQAAMFHRHDALPGLESPLANVSTLSTIRGMGSKKNMETHCEHLEERGAVALLRMVGCLSKGKRVPGWAEDFLLEEDLLSMSAFEEIKYVLAN